MESIEVKKILDEALQLQEVYIKTNDGSHFEIIAVDKQFSDMSRLKQQQLIYGPLMEYIQTNDIHAVSIKTFTPDNWERDKKLISL